MAHQTHERVLDPYSIHPATRLGHVHLKVADLQRQMEFYRDVIGFQVHWQGGASAGMGAGGEDLLHLTEKVTLPRSSNTTGLYHFAILLPDRRELARAIARLFSFRYSNFPTDHVMTKSTYLDDAEGNGIELYADTPEDGTFEFANGKFLARAADGTISDGREPLDLERLFGELAADDRLDQSMPPGTKIGHVHLHVANLPEAMRFYHGLLGFDDKGSSPAYRFGFVSAGGYHHHIGLNTWAGEGAPPPPAGSPGLWYFTIVVPDQRELDGLQERIKNAGVQPDLSSGIPLFRDPSQIGVRIVTEDR
ncbi:MAG TPA: VOC family protein [Anaerolineales bacterium]|nr:VOC family protein [Anaerolineales bacterium]